MIDYIHKTRTGAKMRIVIATTNKNKLSRLSTLISRIRPDIELLTIEQSTTHHPEEKSRSQIENLIIKLNYYHNRYNENVICEDDVFNFMINNQMKTIVNVNQFFSNKNSVYNEWQTYFRINEIHSGNLIKSIGACIHNEIKYELLTFPLCVKSTRSHHINEVNVLNNLVGPYSLGKTFNELSNDQINRFFIKHYDSVLHKLLDIK